MYTITHDLFGNGDADRKEARERYAAKMGHKETCVTCGTGILTGSNSWIIEVVDGGAALVPPGTGDNTDPGYMGAWAIGAHCARMIPAEYLAPYDGFDPRAVARLYDDTVAIRAALDKGTWTAEEADDLEARFLAIREYKTGIAS